MMSDSDLHPDLKFYIECGCKVCDKSLGIQEMPVGYSLVLNADKSHFFWFDISTGRESSLHWSMWAVYRGARNDFALGRPGSQR